ncbi:MAG TPA: glycosyltransferase, partial [Gammaproteobacteria bacterium]|nr:glycosyltransferase [Gammaproteobacteria bacterium]
MSATSRDRRLAIFLSFSGKGGVERMVQRLAGGIAARGIVVDLLAVRAGSLNRDEVPAGVNVIDMGTSHSQLAVLALASYLRTWRPDALLAAKDRAIRTAVLARALARTRTRLVGRLGTTLSAALEGRGAAARWSRYLPMRLLYRHVDAIVAVSDGVAEDTRRIAGLPASRLHVVRNPVIGPDLAARAAEPSPHPWLGGDTPVILGAGRLTRQKDFPTLMRAFSRLRAQRAARLIILG